MSERLGVSEVKETILADPMTATSQLLLLREVAKSNDATLTSAELNRLVALKLKVKAGVITDGEANA